MINRKKSWTLFEPWVWRMAWKDARHNFGRLGLFMASLISGIAAVVALDSLRANLESDIDSNARKLIGADLVVSADKKFTPAITEVFDSTGLDQANETTMASMVYHRKSGQSRLIRLVAFEGAFPFYGEIKTIPDNAYSQIKQGPYAMLDETLGNQFGLKPGDSVKVGNMVFAVSGFVTEIPGGGGLMSTFTPSVYIAGANLPATGLIQFGSRITHKRYFRVPDENNVAALRKVLEPKVEREGYNIETVENRKEGLGRGFANVYQFFTLLAFIALILGCIGVASAVHIYAREKRQDVAVLRCVGSTGWQAFSIFFVQIFILGIASSVIGSLIGIGIQQALPSLLKGIIPFEVSFSFSWKALFLGVALGTVVSILFSVLPLVSVRFVPPLTVLRSETVLEKVFPKTKIAAIILIALFPMLYAALETRSFLTGLFFFLGLAAALALLTLVATLLLYSVRRFFPANASFILRHSLGNLYRPNNQTRVLLVTIGLGAFVISTLNVVEKSMLSQVEFAGQENQSNTILFDIQPSQRDGVISLISESDLKVNQVVPIVTCRLSSVKNKTVAELQQDTTDNVRDWALTREYRVTYRDSLTHSEELIEGEIQRLKPGKDSVFVTMSEGMDENLGVKLGDSLLFDVQGVSVKAIISGIRKVEWPKDPPNFIFVFPGGILENAPQTFVTATRIEEKSARAFQEKMVQQYPNVSLIDLRLILFTVNQLFDKLGLVVRFLALFCLVTGLVVLAGAVANSKYIRIKENVLLRTLGARTRQITMITLIEYAWLGLFATLTGMVLSLGAGFLLTKFFFEMTFAFEWSELLIVAAGVVVLTILIGWGNSREVISTPPLQVLRKET
jgi:putative ABC transport system permease protein